jgi:S-DNA-T family DNA segregation ATPase FtsK/SpoIIIE
MWLRSLGALLALAFVPALFGLMPWRWRWLGMVSVEGVAGGQVAALLARYLNLQGAWLVAGSLAAAGLYFASAVSFWALKESIENRWAQFAGLHNRWADWCADRTEKRAEREAKLAEEAEAAPAEAELRPSRFGALFRRKSEPAADPLDEIPAYLRPPLEPVEPIKEKIPISAPVRRASIWEHVNADLAPAPAEQVAAPNPVPVSASLAPANVAPASVTQSAPRPASLRPVATPLPEQAAPSLLPQPIATRFDEPTALPLGAGIAIHERADADLRPAPIAPKHVSGFRLPPTTLLIAGLAPQSIREDALRDEAKVLVQKCGEFDVRGQVVQINPGPMVTTYEFKPDAGVKYSRVTGLADDLCLAMRAESILIERMAGKSTVGIQVPNHERETIQLRDVLESETFAKAKSRLTLAMGKDINGRIVTADLAAMPHVLIAGSTGSGKSVAINAMIMSLLYRTTPAQVRLILVDPKRVELGMYEGVPHLFTPIITDPKLAANALRNAVREMERRLKLLASRSVRNIDQYNKLFEGSTLSLFGQESEAEEEPLPFIVIIIDELADLMMLDRANVEESITRLAQMARAVGIHLILATQRPSVDVITGLIKANVPTRISFRLATKVDSRTILDTNGAEALLGRGDMLFLPPGTSRLMRLHAPYVSEKETAAVVGFWKAQGEAEYVEGFLESPKDERENVEGSNADPDENDPLFNDAVQLVFEFGKASTSLLQRRLRIGYGRAAHLIDLMERDGLVGPADGSRPRELLKAPNWLHEVAATAIE